MEVFRTCGCLSYLPMAKARGFSKGFLMNTLMSCSSSLPNANLTVCHRMLKDLEMKRGTGANMQKKQDKRIIAIGARIVMVRCPDCKEIVLRAHLTTHPCKGKSA